MNFIEEYKKGQKGGNKGLPMGPGLENVSKPINGVQRGRIYGVAAAPKAGKSTFVDYAFVVQPFLYAQEHNLDIEWIYFSFELSIILITLSLFSLIPIFLILVTRIFGLSEALVPILSKVSSLHEVLNFNV